MAEQTIRLHMGDQPPEGWQLISVLERHGDGTHTVVLSDQRHLPRWGIANRPRELDEQEPVTDG